MAPSKKGVKKSRKSKGFAGLQFQKWKLLQQQKRSFWVTGDNATTATNTITGVSSATQKPTSASRRKLEASKPKSMVPPLDLGNVDYQPDGYRLIDLGQLADALKNIKLCRTGFIKLREVTSYSGLNCELILACSACGKGPSFFTSANITGVGKCADINRRMTYAAIEVGVGREGLATMCSILNMPPPVTPSAFSMHVKMISRTAEEEAEQQMKEAVERAKVAVLGRPPNPSEVVDLCVTFDGTWAKRGFTSNFGVGVVMSADTGEVLDREVLSKICLECCHREGADKGKEEYREWWDQHKEECSQNFTGSSPAMETEAAKQIWQRSVSKYSVRYTQMVCDGDSKAFNAVQNTYGTKEGDMVEKLDCIGHVGKRMFRALDKLRKETKGNLKDGKPVGVGKGRLTGEQKGMVGKLSDLYRIAIRKNVNKEAMQLGVDAESIQKGGGTCGGSDAIKKMQEAILAVLYHEVKIPDDTVRHQYCPSGEWCEYKNNGTMENKEYHLDEVFLDLLKPTFMQLSQESLVKRCLAGLTQNQNESFNACIWKRCPKHLWRGPQSVKSAVNLAVLSWNCGTAVSCYRMMKSLKIQWGYHTNLATARKDKRRLDYGDKSCEKAEKKKKKDVKKKKSVIEETKVEREGVSYESGAF